LPGSKMYATGLAWVMDAVLFIRFNT